jgi:hypothetical protein
MLKAVFCQWNASVELLAGSGIHIAVLVICDYLFTVALMKRLNYEIITLAACARPFQLLNQLTDVQESWYKLYSCILLCV